MHNKHRTLDFGIFALLLLIGGCNSVGNDGANQKSDSHIVGQLKRTSANARYATAEEQLAALHEVLEKTEFEPKLGKNDVLSISVYGEPDLSANNLPIRQDGQISYFLIGEVQAEGKTIAELTEEITEKLSKYLIKPKVSIMLMQSNSLEYTISGEVVKPGGYPLASDVTLAQAVAKAGGLNKGQFHATTVEVADLTHAFLSRRGEMLPVDFVRLLRNGDMRFDVKLKPGDYIYVPSGLSNQVYVLGEVVHPDLLAFKDGLTLAQVLVQAAGFTADADISRIHVVRGSLSNPVLIVTDMNKLLEGKAENLLLEEGDIIYVPPTGLTVWSRIVTKLVPSMTALQTAIIVQKTVIPGLK